MSEKYDARRMKADGGGKHMDRVTVRLPDEQGERLQALVDMGLFPNTSEAVRNAIRSQNFEHRDEIREFRRNGGGE